MKVHFRANSWSLGGNEDYIVALAREGSHPYRIRWRSRRKSVTLSPPRSCIFLFDRLCCAQHLSVEDKVLLLSHFLPQHDCEYLNKYVILGIRQKMRSRQTMHLQLLLPALRRVHTSEPNPLLVFSIYSIYRKQISPFLLTFVLPPISQAQPCSTLPLLRHSWYTN